MLTIDLRGRRAFVAGVSDEHGFGFAIAKALFEGGASVCVGTWPPAHRAFTRRLAGGRLDAAGAIESGGSLRFEQIYPLDATFDEPEDVPPSVRDDRRYRDHAFTLRDVAERLTGDFGQKPLDIVVHCVANGPEVGKPLMTTSRAGYLSALSASSYSFVSMAQRFAPLVREGASFLCLSFVAAQRVVPGYGGGMSSAKAALESDTRVLAFELGRSIGARANCISAGPFPSRAARATGHIGPMVERVACHSPIPTPISAREVSLAAAYLCSDLASGITGSTVYVDHGGHGMGLGFTEVGASLESLNQGNSHDETDPTHPSGLARV